MADFEVALITDCSDDSVCVSLWDLTSGMQLKAYKGGSCPPRGLCLLGENYIVASQVNKPVLHVWNIAKESVHTKLTCPGKISAISCSPDGFYCVVACGELIYVWQVASGNLLALLSRHFQRVTCLKFTDDGSYFLSCGEDSLVLVWKMAKVLSLSSNSLQPFDSTSDPQHTWSDHALPVTDVHCGCGSIRCHVVTSSLDQTCKLYNLSSGELLCSFVFDAGITAVSMDAAEQNLFAGSVNGNIFQVQLSTKSFKDNVHIDKEEALTCRGHSKQVSSLAVSTDGLILLSGSNDQTARVWHVPSRQCIRVANHKGAVTNAQIVPRPLYLDNSPPKNSLPPIRPFKRHVSTPGRSREGHARCHFTATNGEVNKDVVPVVMKGNLGEESDVGFAESHRRVQVAQVIRETTAFEAEEPPIGKKRKLSRRELEEEMEKIKRVHREFYKFAVEELMAEVHSSVDKGAT